MQINKLYVASALFISSISLLTLNRYLSIPSVQESKIVEVNMADVKQDDPVLSVVSEISPEIVPVAASFDPIEKETTIFISNGDTLLSILTRVGTSLDQAHKIIDSLKTVFDPRAFKIGQEIILRYRQVDKQPISILSLSFKSNTGNEVVLEQESAGTYAAKKHEVPLKKELRQVEGMINTSFYSAAVKKGVPAAIVKEAISALSFDINWQHDPKPGDKFSIIHEVYTDKDGTVIKNGELKFASFAPGGNVRCIYHYQPASGGAAGYFNDKGESVTKSLLQTPLDPTKIRVTSKFGNRHHPILGYSKMHKGVDFKASVGTPVMCAGAGIVRKAGWFSTYGKYVLVEHASGYSTAYAHLSKIDVKVGDRVRQRQVVGAVGMTGRTSGPHLHYEVIHKGRHINPQGIKQLPSIKLLGKDLSQFMQVKATYEKSLMAQRQYAVQAMPVVG